MEKVLTGVRDLDMKIINQLNDYELTQVCQVNKYVNNICNDEIFWMNRVVNRFGKYLGTAEEIKKKYLFGVYAIPWQEYYKLLTRYLRDYPGKIDRIRVVRTKEYFYRYGGADEIKREDFVKILDVKYNNNELLELYADEEQDLEKVKELVENTDKDFIILDFGMYTFNVDIIRYLLSKGADPDIDDYNPIRSAMDAENYDILHLMLEHSDFSPDEVGDPEALKIFLEMGRLSDEALKEFMVERMEMLNKDELVRLFNCMVKEGM